jgi:hypothetical protein
LVRQGNIANITANFFDEPYDPSNEESRKNVAKFMDAFFGYLKPYGNDITKIVLSDPQREKDKVFSL